MRLSTGLILCMFVSGYLRAAGDPSPLSPYITAMKELGKGCSMKYSAEYVYPDKRRELVSGFMAIAGDSYLDSSNTRFVLKNQTWLVTADHASRMLNVLYLPDLRKQTGRDYELDVSGFLFPELDLTKPAAFRFSAGKNDTLTAALKYVSAEGPTITLQLWYGPGSVVPSRYQGTVTFPQDSGDPSASLSIHFVCSDVKTTAEPALFDDRRLIETTGNRKARMKRYNNYLVYRRNA